MNNPGRIAERIKPILPQSIADGISAVYCVRENGAKLSLDVSKIGFIGFSAGGVVAMGVACYAKTIDWPDFIVPVYPWTSAFGVQEAPKNRPKTLIFCTSDDPLSLAKGSIELYNSWLSAGHLAAFQMYAQGGHGFGMKSHGLPSDDWIQPFYELSVATGITTVSKN